jgi:hypothetical protein
MMKEALDGIEKLAEDALGCLETGIRRLGGRLSRPSAQQPRSVAIGDRGRVEGTRRRR